MRRSILLALLLLVLPPDVAFAQRTFPGGTPTASGSGTANTLMKFDSAGNAADSLLSDDGTNVTLASGALLLPAGTYAAPALIFNADNTNALFSSGGVLAFRGGFNVYHTTSSTTKILQFGTGDVGYVDIASTGAIRFGDASIGALDTIIARAAAATSYFYGSSTAVGATLRLGNTNVGYEDFARNSEAHTLAAAGTSTTATAVWPANSSSQAASFRITTEITGCTSVQVGVAGDTTRYGTFSTLTAGQTLAIGRVDNYAAETGVLFTCVGGGASFTAGVVRVNLRYITASAAAS